MRMFLNAGFGQPIGAQTLADIARLGFKGVRQDITGAMTSTLVEEFLHTPLSPIFVIEWASNPAELAQDVAWLAKNRMDYAIEVGNELNIDYPGRRRIDPAFYADAFAEIESALYRIDPACKVITAGINTTSRAGLEWLRIAIAHATPQAIAGYHTYRRNMMPEPSAPQEGFQSRDQEFAKLQQVTEDRRLWNTEIGWHNALRESGWWLFRRSFRLSDTEVLAYLRREATLNHTIGAEVMTVYQLNDGKVTSPDPLDHYGIRDPHGNWKPQSKIGEWQ